ncbi:MAG: GNAT family N-acetyltransferase [Bacteroidota bacterium]
MSIQIREAEYNDAPVIVEFNSLIAKETEGKSLDRQRLLRGVQTLLSDPKKGIYYLAEIDGTIVGQLMITYEWSDWRNGNFWWIQSVYVRKDQRMLGVFTSLFHYVESLARKRSDVCGLRLYADRNNTRAQQTYEHLGMKRAHYEMFEIDFILQS